MEFPDYNNLDPNLKDYLDLLDTKLNVNRRCAINYSVYAFCKNKKTGEITKEGYSSNNVFAIPGRVTKCSPDFKESPRNPCPCSNQTPCGWRYDPNLLNFILEDLNNAINQALSNRGKCRRCESSEIKIEHNRDCGRSEDDDPETNDPDPFPGQPCPIPIPIPGSPPKPPVLVPPGQPFDPGTFPDAIFPDRPKNDNSKVSYADGKNGNRVI